MIVVGNATELINAISGLPSAGDTIYMLPGTYDFTSPINLSSNTMIIGAGTGSTVLNFSDCDGFVFYYPEYVEDEYGLIQFVTIRGMTINTTGGGRGFTVNVSTSPYVQDLNNILLADLLMTCDGVSVDLDPVAARGGDHEIYCQAVVIDNINFEIPGAGVITMNGNENVLRGCNLANTASDTFTVTDGLVRVTGTSNLLSSMVIGVANKEVPACFYLGGGSFNVLSCHAEGGQIDRGIWAVNAGITIDHFDWVPDIDAETLVAAIDAQNSSVVVQYLDLESVYSLTTPAPGAGISWFAIDSTSTASIETVNAERDVGHLFDTQIAIQQVVCDGIEGSNGPYSLNYPPPTRSDSLIPDITTWTMTSSGTGTISEHGTRTRADDKTQEYYVTVASVGAGFEFAVVISGITAAASSDYTLQFRADVPGDPAASTAAVEAYYNDYTQQLVTRQHDSLTATKFNSGDSAVSSLEFSVGSPTTGTYALSDVGLWTTY